MIKLLFSTMRWDDATDQPKTEVLATVEIDEIDGRVLSVDGDGQYFDPRVAVIDPETGDDLTFESDPERWAANLHYAYRYGDVQVTAERVAEPMHAGSGQRRR